MQQFRHYKLYQDPVSVPLQCLGLSVLVSGELRGAVVVHTGSNLRAGE